MRHGRGACEGDSGAFAVDARTGYVTSGACVATIAGLLGAGAVAGKADLAVFMLGDSVTVGATPTIEAGGPRTVGRDRHRRSAARRPRARRSSRRCTGTCRRLWSWSSATTTTARHRPRFRDHVDTVIRDLTGVDHVVWYTMTPFASWVPAANTVLQQAADRWPNLELADWATVADATPDALAGSGPHLQPAGGEAFATLLFRELEQVLAARARRGVVPRLAARDRCPRQSIPELPRSAMLGVNPAPWSAGRARARRARWRDVYACAGERFYGSLGATRTRQ